MTRQVVVVGSGIAGLIAALELSAKFYVTLVTKLELAESNTRWAQGGIAAVMFEDDTVAEHVADTLRAGAGLCNHEAVEVLCAEGPGRIRDLIRLGVQFDEHDGELARGMEAAHSHARVLHAKGDATGLSIEMALVHAVRRANVTVMEHTFACDLVLEDERVAGLEIREADGTRRVLRAEAVVLASGGAGQLYLHTTNPAGATGDGTALALRAGAQIADAEFYQFHPTALAVADTFLISEAVRGEGAVLLDAQGRRFMQALHEGAELAPRDVVARGIAMQMAAQGGEPVMLDATALGAAFLRERFPSITAACERRGFDFTTQPVPVTPAAHYWMGGVKTDLWGRTSVQGLFSVGEVACTGVHGANRLASNSLLESLVFAWRCAAFLNDERGERSGRGVTQRETWPVFEGEVLEAPVVERDAGLGHLWMPVEGKSEGPDRSRRALQELMWSAVGIERSGAALRAALEQLVDWRVTGEDVEALETANLLEIARVVTAGALTRLESRGAHFRVDYLETREEWRRSLVFAQKVGVVA